jgi:hypothetical protein
MQFATSERSWLQSSHTHILPVHVKTVAADIENDAEYQKKNYAVQSDFNSGMVTVPFFTFYSSVVTPPDEAILCVMAFRQSGQWCPKSIATASSQIGIVDSQRTPVPHCFRAKMKAPQGQIQHEEGSTD